ncbi:hypothetical protein ACQEU5_24320 [Marinactinospora thermotolerans]|uniref:hypothetical protein n=1 Tax=Marinactinospora thermotolerans TaxID=531310 RepID=UPI003D8A8CA8
MDTGLIIGLVIIAVIVVIAVAAALVILPGRRSRHLKQKFGPEYDRELRRHPDRRSAERELARREKRHAKLHIRPLSAESRTQYAEGWARIQERFVDEPVEAVREADRLVTRLMADRGYPTDGYEQQVADLSVEHARTIGHYRDGREIGERGARGEATTEDLRNAMVHYRTLFAELLETDPRGADGQSEHGPAEHGAAHRPSTDSPRSDAAR